MAGLLNGAGDLDDNIRMLKRIGAKFLGRAYCVWGQEADFPKNLERARVAAARVLAADSEMILEACVFENVTPQVDKIVIPEWVFTAFGLPVEARSFRFHDMIYTSDNDRFRRQWSDGGQVPDISRRETQFWFYFQAVSYIDIGCDSIHFGQVEIMNRTDPDNEHWDQLLNLVRTYAAKKGRHHMVLCNAHVPSGGLIRDNRLLLDFHCFPLRIKEVPDQPRAGILELGHSDGIYGRSKGGSTFSGWECDHLPYFVELDNYGISPDPGKPRARGPHHWVWGYDEITWFALQDKDYRSEWLKYAWNWVRATDSNGFLEMPGSRMVKSSALQWYFANNPSHALPQGLGDEATIRAIWAADAAAQANAR
jgi:hypothetical protein